MKRICILTTLILSLLHAHTLLINVFNNDDNTMTIEGIYSTGEKAAGAMIRLESLITGKVLYKKRLPLESEITIDIPKEPYQMVLDGGPGHIIVREGIEPKEGFSEKFKSKIQKNISEKLSKEEINTGEWTDISVILFFICVLLFILAIYFSFKNTNKILNEIKNKG